jgi:hypothetical protein
MKQRSRRRFIRDLGIGLGMTAAAEAEPFGGQNPTPFRAQESRRAASFNTQIDFRYSPLSGQTAYCFPDDPHKSLVGERGDLRFGHPGQYKDINHFPQIVEFSLEGMERDSVKSQKLEQPSVPIVHTVLERPEARIELTAFATNSEAEGRADNVILEVSPRGRGEISVAPVAILKTHQTVTVQAETGLSSVRIGNETGPPFMVADSGISLLSDGLYHHRLALGLGVASRERPVRRILRFPQEGQSAEKLRAGLNAPSELLKQARLYWERWKPYGGNLSWSLPGRHGEFLVACARNIQQAREVKDGRVTFQVGPTVYRGLWVADGNFILEAARYLGYDEEAQQGLEATWNRQRPNGGVFAGGGDEHWKETGIALFTITRQAELAQDWTYFRRMQPNILAAFEFVRSLREKAQQDGSACGRYGLLPPGFPDGGIGGIREELTNTIWTLAGLKAASEAGERLGLAGFGPAQELFLDLRSAFFAAAKQEMRRHPAGFDYLPMLLKADPAWAALDAWERPRPQAAQWALSQAIYPGTVFDRKDPIVEGHIRLMQTCTREDIPAETGWLTREGVWNYGAAFVAHVYLWAGLPDWARRTFVGFLNHATPLYCWREEQPLRGSLIGSYVGDMPHNWASAECILYLRHMLLLEDGQDLRLLEGVGWPELKELEPLSVRGSPTRFGRVNCHLEPAEMGLRWTLRFSRQGGPNPAALTIPAQLAPKLRFVRVRGASYQQAGDKIRVDPQVNSWEATWKA